MILESVTIQKFGKIEDCDLQFNERFNVFVGKNATGKSEILLLLMELCDCNFLNFHQN